MKVGYELILLVFSGLSGLFGLNSSGHGIIISPAILGTCWPTSDGTYTKLTFTCDTDAEG